MLYLFSLLVSLERVISWGEGGERGALLVNTSWHQSTTCFVANPCCMWTSGMKCREERSLLLTLAMQWVTIVLHNKVPRIQRIEYETLTITEEVSRMCLSRDITLNQPISYFYWNFKYLPHHMALYPSESNTYIRKFHLRLKYFTRAHVQNVNGLWNSTKMQEELQENKEEVQAGTNLRFRHFCNNLIIFEDTDVVILRSNQQLHKTT